MSGARVGGWRLVVFDLDGTLMDSRRDLADAANATLEVFGLPPLAVDAVARMIGEGARVLVHRVFAARGTDPPSGALDVFLQQYDRRLVVHTRAYAGAVETVTAIAARARVAVLTNKPQRPAERILDHFGLLPHVTAVVGGDGPLPRKPEIAGLVSLADAAGTSASEALIVGDSWVDHETACRADAGICLARYGFGYAPLPPDRVRGDELYIDRLADLPALAGCADDRPPR